MYFVTVSDLEVQLIQCECALVPRQGKEKMIAQGDF